MLDTRPIFYVVIYMCLNLACDDGAGGQNGNDDGDGGQNGNNGNLDSIDIDTNNTGGSDPGQVCDIGDMSAVCANGPLSSVVLTDANNYAFTSSLNIKSIQVRGGSPLVDIDFDWGSLTKDFMGHALNPLIDIEMALISIWNASQAEMKQMLDNDALEMDTFHGAIMAYPKDEFTSENLVDFTLYGTPIEAPDDVQMRDNYFNSDDSAYNPDEWTHMFLVQTNSDRPGNDISMIQFFTLDSNSNNTVVSMTDDSSTLDWDVDLRSLARIPVAQNNAAININWEYMFQNAMGREFVPTMINRVVVAHYSMSVCDLETQFLDVESVHDRWYEGTMENVGVEFNLSSLIDGAGNPFPGITNDGGLWIVALFCNEDKCSNPAPLFLSILQPC